MTTDMMTKGLTHEQHCKLREKAGMFELYTIASVHVAIIVDNFVTKFQQNFIL